MANAEKHSGASAVIVDIRADGDGVRALVSDRGRGFDSSTIAERGLASSVRARLADAGISLDLHSSAGRGVHAEMWWHPTAERPLNSLGDVQRDVERIRMIGALLISAGVPEEALSSDSPIILASSRPTICCQRLR